MRSFAVDTGLPRPRRLTEWFEPGSLLFPQYFNVPYGDRPGSYRSAFNAGLRYGSPSLDSDQDIQIIGGLSGVLR